MLNCIRTLRNHCRYWLTAGAEPSTKVTELLGRVGVLPEPPLPPSYQRTPEPNLKWHARLHKEK